MKQKKQQGNGQRLQNKDGMCRRLSSRYGLRSREDADFSGFDWGAEICRAPIEERFQARSVVTSDKASNQSSLQLLREQAERMTKALEEIQAKIRLAEQQ